MSIHSSYDTFLLLNFLLRFHPPFDMLSPHILLQNIFQIYGLYCRDKPCSKGHDPSSYTQICHSLKGIPYGLNILGNFPK